LPAGQDAGATDPLFQWFGMIPVSAGSNGIDIAAARQM
jgi:hypothetical protein